MTWPTIAADWQRPLIERPRRDMTLQSIQLLVQTLPECGVHCYEMLNGATVRPSSDFDARFKGRGASAYPSRRGEHGARLDKR